MQRSFDTATAFDKFCSTVSTAGVGEGLAFLLRLTDYRFIGIWRFQDGKANAAVHFDRENPSTMHATEVPDEATYRCYVRSTQGVVNIADALLDRSTEGHPVRHVVATYSGVLVMDAEGGCSARFATATWYRGTRRR